MSIPAEFVCPLSQMVMIDPVSTSDGATFERQYIEEWMKTKMTNPVTGKALASKAVVRNQKCRAQIEEWSAQALAAHNDVQAALKHAQKLDADKRLDRLRLRILANQREQKGFNLMLLKENASMTNRIVQLEQELKGKNSIFESLTAKTSPYAITTILDKSILQWGQAGSFGYVASTSPTSVSSQSHRRSPSDTVPAVKPVALARSRTGSFQADGHLPLLPAPPAVGPPPVAAPAIKPNTTVPTISATTTIITTAPPATTTTATSINLLAPLGSQGSNSVAGSSQPPSRRNSPSRSSLSSRDNSPGASPIPSPTTSPSSSSSHSRSHLFSSTSQPTVQQPKQQQPVFIHTPTVPISSPSTTPHPSPGSCSSSLSIASSSSTTSIATSTVAAATHAFLAAHGAFPNKRRSSLGSPPLASLVEEQARPPSPSAAMPMTFPEEPPAPAVSSLKMAALSKLQSLTGATPFSPESGGISRQLSSPDPSLTTTTATTTSKWRFGLSSDKDKHKDKDLSTKDKKIKDEHLNITQDTSSSVSVTTDERGSTSSAPGHTSLPKTPNKEANSLKFLNFGMSSPPVSTKPTHEKALYELMSHFKKNNAYEKWRELFEETTDVNAKSLGDTALVTAARRSEKKVVKMLIEALADVNLPAENGDTALIWAARKGDAKICKMLVEAKADVNMPDNDGNSPLVCAQAEGHEDAINFLKVAVEAAGPVDTKKPKHGRSRTTTVDIHKLRSRSVTREGREARADNQAPSRDGSAQAQPPPRDSREHLRSP